MSKLHFDYKSLDELGLISRGRSKHRPRDAAHLYGGKYPFVQTGDIKHAGLYLTQYSQTYSEAGLAQSKLWPAGTLCITIAANIAETTILGIDACFPDSVIGFIANDKLADVHYIKYLFDSQLKRQYQQYSQGVAQDNLSQEKLLSIKFPIPPLPIQRKIAAVLTALDDKIALNKRINDKLEAMAKRLYDYWFVQFDFPDENGRPYKSSGGKMVWNETLKREIPVGWEVKRLGDVLSILKDGTHNPPKRLSTGIPLLTGTMFGNNFLNYENATYISKCDYDIIHTTYQPQANDLIITKIGTLGNVNILRKQDIPIAIHCNSALIRFPNNYGISFPFYFLKSNLFLRRLKSVKGQSIQEFASLESISTINMEIPNQTTINLFNSKVNSMLEHEEQLYNEIFYLTALRDRLLPLLMNGQVVVEGEF